jgi:hypothetical protein
MTGLAQRRERIVTIKSECVGLAAGDIRDTNRARAIGSS